MQISITATLTEEQALIIAKEKGYQETISNLTQNGEGLTVNIGDSLNPESPGEFLKRVYEAMVVQDATSHFVVYENRKYEAQRRASEEVIRNEIVSAVSASVS